MLTLCACVADGGGIVVGGGGCWRSSDRHRHRWRRQSVFVPTVRAVRMPRAFIRRRTRAASPAIPVATAAAVFANWLRRRRRQRRAGARGGEVLGRARVSSSRGVRRPRRAQSVYAYHRRPYHTSASVVRPTDRVVIVFYIRRPSWSSVIIIILFFTAVMCVHG